MFRKSNSAKISSMTCLLRISLYVLFFLVAVQSINAELPPSVYQELQEKSAEALSIKVESVKIDKSEESALTRLSITARAKVESVTRSASGLMPGDRIRINYTYVDHKQPIAGPSEPDILKEGRSYPAFLTGEDGVYTPAARGYSFRLAR